MTPSFAYAAQSKAAPLTPFRFDRREPGPTDVVLDIDFCGICHSDIHQVRGEWGRELYPMVPGHEIVDAGFHVAVKSCDLKPLKSSVCCAPFTSQYPTLSFGPTGYVSRNPVW